MAGRQESVTANSSASIGGVTTATLTPTGARDARTWGAVLIHEAFHVFQRRRHPWWVANEADLFTFPVEDSVILAGRRLEYEGWRRALRAKVPDESCWARVALTERDRWFARAGASAATYERRTELNEGLAQYVEARASGARAMDLMPTREFGADSVRSRAYMAGLAIGQVLDSIAPGWRDQLEHADSTRTLDDLVSEAVGNTTGTCGFTEAERRRAVAEARSAITRLHDERTRVEHAVLSREGWRIVIDAPTSPLFPQSFDPLNVLRLSSSRVLHGRMLKLAAAGTVVDILGRDAITDAAGSHPLFNGVRRVTLTGFETAPMVRDSSGVMLLSAPGVTGRFPGAKVDTAGREIRIEVRSPR
jgi:hypothetical protein